MAGAVLLTGASSFTGYWIARSLAADGWRILAPLHRPRDAYEGVRRERVEALSDIAEVAFDVTFGEAAFLDLVRGGGFDALAHHASDVENYRSPDFDAERAVARNTHGAAETFRLLAEGGARAVLATGTVFEADEGGDPAREGSITPYGLSKTLTNVALAERAGEAGLAFGRFVIPSPYGVFEEKRFGWHLFRTWAAGETPEVRTPVYIRDHLPAPLLAQAYAAYLARLMEAGAPPVHRPSGWIASQGAFAEKTAAEASARLGRPCPLRLLDQPVLEEPLLCVNAEPVDRDGWDEAGFWDDYVGWYERLRGAGRLA